LNKTTDKSGFLQVGEHLVYGKLISKIIFEINCYVYKTCMRQVNPIFAIAITGKTKEVDLQITQKFLTLLKKAEVEVF
jgi:hypothetical protein